MALQKNYFSNNILSDSCEEILIIEMRYSLTCDNI